METPPPDLRQPQLTYEIRGIPWESSSQGFANAQAEAHATRQRPRCMCQIDGVEMYVARLADSFIIKRMPNTGSRHAPDCPSYEPPADVSGLGQVLGTAITEDPNTGETTLKLDFSLSKMPGRAKPFTAGDESDSVRTDGTKLSLRGLLHYLWDQAELTRWQPAFAGKRNWATVRRHLLQAAENKQTRGAALASRLYIPEVFALDRRDALNSRRLAQWSHAIASPGKPQPLMLLIAEVKEIVRARFGFKAVVKHVPDQSFAIDEKLYRRLGRRFETELALWGNSESIHMVMIATFGVSDAGLPKLGEISLMPVTGQWLPIENVFEEQLIALLLAEGRSFVKGLRYNLTPTAEVASATLTDCEGSAPVLWIGGADTVARQQTPSASAPSVPTWQWNPASETLPPLPRRQPCYKGAAKFEGTPI